MAAAATSTTPEGVHGAHDTPVKFSAADVQKELETLKSFSTEELAKAYETGSFPALLSQAEFGRFIEQVLEIPQDSVIIPRLFQLSDINHDGKIDFKEICALFACLSVGEEVEKLSFLFSLFDLNGDGMVSQEELATLIDTFWKHSKVLGLVRFAGEEARLYGADVFAKRLFAELDRNHDGLISKEEYLTATKRYIRFGVPQIMDTQTGGHVGAFQVSVPGQLMKKTSAAERLFYSETRAATPGLAPFCPSFFGLDGESIIMEDLCRGYSKPCILDLKMGTSSIGEDASPEKQEAMRKKDEKTTSVTLGFRFAGMRVWNSATGVFDRYNKSWGQSVTVEGFDEALLLFFGSAASPNKAVIRRFLKRLEDLQAYMTTQRHLRFYSSSLLFVYDGENPETEERLKMIDFAHVFPITDGGLDDKYLVGLNGLVERFRSYAA